MKSKWLNNFRTEWLVMGHLTEEEARLLVQESEKQLIYRHYDGKEEIPNTRLVQLQPRSVYDYQEINEDPANPNSAVLAVF
jgi:secreted Zn-dependent insulinase-like peptidase